MHPSMWLFTEQDVYQPVTANRKSYEDLSLTAWERSELVSSTLMPTWSFEWLLILNDTSMYAAVFFSLQSWCLMHTEKPTGIPLHKHNLVSDSANPHYVSDPLPRPLWDHRSTGQL